jgi:hypothetical protein
VQRVGPVATTGLRNESGRGMHPDASQGLSPLIRPLDKPSDLTGGSWATRAIFPFFRINGSAGDCTEETKKPSARLAGYRANGLRCRRS